MKKDYIYLLNWDSNSLLSSQIIFNDAVLLKKMCFTRDWLNLVSTCNFRIIRGKKIF